MRMAKDIGAVVAAAILAAGAGGCSNLDNAKFHSPAGTLAKVQIDREYCEGLLNSSYGSRAREAVKGTATLPIAAAATILGAFDGAAEIAGESAKRITGRDYDEAIKLCMEKLGYSYRE